MPAQRTRIAYFAIIVNKLCAAKKATGWLPWQAILSLLVPNDTTEIVLMLELPKMGSIGKVRQESFRQLRTAAVG
jgi:hypothetical protein